MMDASQAVHIILDGVSRKTLINGTLS